MAELTAIDELRRMVRNFGDCRESFVQCFTISELVAMHRAWMASGWDIYPDQWTRLQVNAALEGYPPQFNPTTEEPIEPREHGPWEPDAYHQFSYWGGDVIDAEYPELDEPDIAF